MVKRIVDDVTGRVKRILLNTNEKEINEFVKMIINSKDVFVIGAGRSGLVAKSFAMRLMHLDFNVYVVGETITPSVKPGDIVIAISGSGKTPSTLTVAKTAKDLGVKVASVTSYEDSPLGRLSDCIIKISGREIGDSEDYVSKQLTGQHEPLTPLGTLFELSSMILLDSVIIKLMNIYGKRETDLGKKHSNLE